MRVSQLSEHSAGEVWAELTSELGSGKDLPVIYKVQVIYRGIPHPVLGALMKVEVRG